MSKNPRFLVHVFDTRELGRLVTHRLPPENGGLGDITTNKEGLVISGHFDLSSPESRAGFLQAFKAAEDLIQTLREGSAEEVKDLENLELPSTLDEGYRQTVLGATIKADSLLSVGLKGLHLSRDFSTVVKAPNDKGELVATCCLCRRPLGPDETGVKISREKITQIGLYSKKAGDNAPPIVVESDSTPEPTTFKDAWAQSDHIFFHDCAKKNAETYRTVFTLPTLIEKKA